MDEPLHRVTTYTENPFELRISADLGHAVRLMRSTLRASESLNVLCRAVWPAIVLNQIEFLFNSKGIPAGFVTWAFLTRERAEVLARHDDFDLHLSEWNEGCELWVMDVFAPTGGTPALARKFRRRVGSTHDFVHGVRRHLGHKPRRLVRLGMTRSDRRDGTNHLDREGAP